MRRILSTAAVVMGMAARSAAGDASDLWMGGRVGYRAYADGDLDGFDNVDFGVHFLSHARKNVGFGVLLDRTGGSDRDMTLTVTRLAAHLMYFQQTANHPHFFGGVGPALTYAEADYGTAWRRADRRGDDNETALGVDLLGGYFLPIRDWGAITLDLRLNLLFLSDMGQEENFSSLSPGAGLMIGLD